MNGFTEGHSAQPPGQDQWVIPAPVPSGFDYCFLWNCTTAQPVSVLLRGFLTGSWFQLHNLHVTVSFLKDPKLGQTCNRDFRPQILRRLSQGDQKLRACQGYRATHWNNAPSSSMARQPAISFSQTRQLGFGDACTKL